MCQKCKPLTRQAWQFERHSAQGWLLCARPKNSNALEAIRFSVEGCQRVRRDRRNRCPGGPPKAGRIKPGIRLAMSGSTKGVGSRPLDCTGEVSGRQSLGFLDKVSGMAQKLGIPMTPELMQLGTNEAISNALVEIAVGMGKSEEEISSALGAE